MPSSEKLEEIGSKSARRIALLHHVSGANLGDGATIDAVIRNIRERCPSAEIIGLSMNPEDTLRRHGIPSHPIRRQVWNFGNVVCGETPALGERLRVTLRRYPRLIALLRVINALLIRPPVALVKELVFLARSLRVVRDIDLLIVCGGGQLLESSGGPWAFLGGPWEFPYTIFKWVALARLTGARCMVLNVGAGPVKTTLGKFFLRRALLLTSYASFRDEESKALMQQIGFTDAAPVLPDSAYSLPCPVRRLSRVAQAHASGGIVGFAPMAYGDPRQSPLHSASAYNTFVRELGRFGFWIASSGFCLTLFCTDISLDPPVIEDLEPLLKSDRHVAMKAGSSLSRVHQWSTQDVLVNMSSMDYVVACRFHAVVFAHMLNKPVLAIGHHPKVTALMNDLGLSEYCVALDDCKSGVLAERFESLVKNRDEIKERMAAKLTGYREQLERQFDELFPRPSSLLMPERYAHAEARSWNGESRAHCRNYARVEDEGGAS